MAKLIIDGAGARIAEGAAALMLLIWLRLELKGASPAGRDASWVTYTLLATLLVWVLLTRLLGGRLAPSTAGPDCEDEFRPDVPLPDS